MRPVRSRETGKLESCSGRSGEGMPAEAVPGHPGLGWSGLVWSLLFRATSAQQFPFSLSLFPSPPPVRTCRRAKDDSRNRPVLGQVLSCLVLSCPQLLQLSQSSRGKTINHSNNKTAGIRSMNHSVVPVSLGKEKFVYEAMQCRIFMMGNAEYEFTNK